MYIPKNPKRPIRDKEQIKIMREYLLCNGKVRDEFLYTLTLNTGRRMGDIVGLRVKDIKNKDYLIFEEQKTGKIARVFLHNIKSDILKYCIDKKDNDFLFESRQRKYSVRKHITYNTAYKIFKKLFTEFKIEQSATHTLRKTFGYWHYKVNKDLEALRIIFNHSSVEVTRRYICIYEDHIDKTVKAMGKL